jgi:guanine deaminase
MADRMTSGSAADRSSSIAFMREAIRLAAEGVAANRGGPFGAIIVKDGQIIARGCNLVTSTNDPTAHAEIVAIRDACRSLGVFHLVGCEIYASCEPCPMCLAAIYWARIDRYFFACTAQDAAAIQFADDFIRRELSLAPQERSIPAQQLLHEEALAVFRSWQAKSDRVAY